MPIDTFKAVVADILFFLKGFYILNSPIGMSFMIG